MTCLTDVSLDLEPPTEHVLMRGIWDPLHLGVGVAPKGTSLALGQYAVKIKQLSLWGFP